ncbi:MULTISPECIES: PfkB family carbohydrate kinase [Runella]|uniref:Sugar/nucleoside kinase (Ribokinase family) n=1 Tax=Runella defluvii TaxID=370973 RepID=A0A7W5ZJY2_9BACT|nr:MULTISPECIES: PfkB family carbohydrate kinase [Runella]MBB3838683.1 sugar/nucleoside kinase (ribokinase family) [Runella defluvii]MCA0229163.1 PfkB family carbohydrate kinase [Bacteroidota bacterium]HAK77339.1 sugar kinase [Runella sp.]HAO51532.1 sugar kinase [Runella sp.]
MSLLTVGSVAFDAIETPFGKTDKIVGGAATYITLTASYFTKKNNIIGVVGGDFPKEMIETLEQHGVNTEGLEIKPEGKTFFWSGKYHNDMNSRDTLDTQLNVFGDFDPIIPASYQDCTYLMLGNMVPALQMAVLDRLNNRPKFVMLDTMNLWMNIALEDLKAVIAKVDCLTVNDEEARMLSGDYSLRRAAKTIMAMGPKTLIIKKGEHGALLFQGDEVFFCPALPLEEVFDPTGAGDTFAGGFIGYLASTDDISFANMKRAIVYGSAMASFCVEKFGPERIIDLTQAEIDARVQEFVLLSTFHI